MLIADNFQITRPSIAKAVGNLDTAGIQEMVARWLAAGAQAIDINPGPLPKDPERSMTFLVETIAAACRLPLLLDTVNPAAIRAALEVASSQAIINGLSLEPQKLERILPLALRFKVPVICYLLRSDGHVPSDAQGRLEIALQLWQEVARHGLEPDQFIVDPVLVPLGWADGSNQAMEVLATLRYLPDVLGFTPKTIVGLSNLTTGSPSRQCRLAMEQAYLPMLVASGIRMLLMNIEHRQTVAMARNCNLLSSRAIFSWQQVAF